MKRILLLLLLTSLALASIDCSSSRDTLPKEDAVTDLGIIPNPLKTEKLSGTFTITPDTRIIIDAKDSDVAGVGTYLQENLRASTGMGLAVNEARQDAAPSSAIVLTLKGAAADLGPEGYSLTATGNLVTISSTGAAGLFYGVQTLRQLLPPQALAKTVAHNISWTIPCVKIQDKPRFSWRGMQLDVSRHFFPKENIKEYIDILALHKMNVFHWHLTDDNGWRIEIKKYPKLTQIGAWRADREKYTWNDRTPQQPGEPATYGGFYTQDDIREVVAYAKSRFITVVPEIEMPGHSVAVLAAYPEYSCTGGPFTVRTGGYWPNIDICCAGNDATFEFLQNVLSEVVDLFPGQFIHVGGDEADKTNWKTCPKCQARMANEHLTDVEELQSYFIRRIEKFLNARGKRLIGWDEILQGGLAPNATVMSWRGIDGGIAAARQGHDVVMTPTEYCYFDYYQATSGEPEGIGGFVPLEKVYSYEPVPGELTADQKKHILGAQANIWTEYIGTFSHVEYMALPRLCALAEIDWLPPEMKDYDNFLARMRKHYSRLDQMGVNYRANAPAITPDGGHVMKSTTKAVDVRLTNTMPGTLHYTLDGSEPTAASPVYAGPLTLNGTSTVRALTILPGGKRSAEARADFSFLDPDLNGVQYEYYEGIWSALPDFNALTPVRTGKVYSIGLKGIETRADHFAIRFTSTIDIPADGSYIFYTKSDDGSRLFIDGRLVVDNDGSHGTQEKSGSVNLKAGKHPVTVLFFDDTEDQLLEVSYEGPGIAKRVIPPGALFAQ